MVGVSWPKEYTLSHPFNNNDDDDHLHLQRSLRKKSQVFVADSLLGLHFSKY